MKSFLLVGLLFMGAVGLATERGSALDIGQDEKMVSTEIGSAVDLVTIKLNNIANVPAEIVIDVPAEVGMDDNSFQLETVVLDLRVTPRIRDGLSCSTV